MSLQVIQGYQFTYTDDKDPWFSLVEVRELDGSRFTKTTENRSQQEWDDADHDKDWRIQESSLRTAIEAFRRANS